MLLLCLSSLSCSQDGEVIALSGSTMGTRYTVKLTALPPEVGRDALQGEIDGILARVNRHMSTWDPDSELSRFNASASTDWVTMSEETVRVVGEALEVSRLTDGAFDVTVGPLVDLWGFGPEPRPEAAPSREQVAAARERVGFRRLQLQETGPALRKEHPQLRIDLSAIAKGYAVDQLAEHLERRGVADYMVEIGGEVRARGVHPRGTPWRIGIERPVAGGRSVYRVIQVDGRGLATSGDYRNFIEVDGRRLSHTIDPRTGRPVTHELASVTVMASSSMRADAIATGLLALGPEAAADLAEREKIAALFILRTSEGFREASTPEIGTALVGEPRR